MLENTDKDIDNTNKAELKKQKQREYYLKNKEQFKERYQKHRENDIETFRQKNRERKKKYYDKNPEKFREAWHIYYKKKCEEDPNFKDELHKKIQLRNLNKKLAEIEQDLLSRLFVRKYKTKNNKQNETETTTAESGNSSNEN